MKINFLSSASVIALVGTMALAPAFLGDQAHAVPINGSDSIISVGVTPGGGVGDLLTATSFVFSTSFWGTGSVNFTLIPPGTPLTPATLTIASLGAFTFSSADGSFAAAPSIVIGSNTYSSAIVGSSGSIATGSESLSIYIVGNITPAGTTSSLDPDNASETISFTETGITTGASPSFGSFSVSATIASPAAAPPAAPPPTPPTVTPEPASMMLLGAGLVGLGVVRRRRATSL